jgi:hypothetical protein
MATSKWSSDLVLDAALDKIATATMLRVCSGSSNPATRAEAVTATLASVAVDSGDFAKSDGVSGRKVTVSAQVDIPITGVGTQDATCITLDDGTNLLYVIPATTKSLTNGDKISTPAWSAQFSDPTA